MTVFSKEADFEQALIEVLFTKGWEKEILHYPTEQDLIENWAKILFDNNRERDRLNDQPLTDGEMAQILEQIENLRTPLKLNGFINGGSVSVKRDNPADPEHFGKEISLKIYNRKEIAAGSSRYQIARQPQFPTKSPILHDRLSLGAKTQWYSSLPGHNTNRKVCQRGHFHRPLLFGPNLCGHGAE